MAAGSSESDGAVAVPVADGDRPDGLFLPPGWAVAGNGALRGAVYEGPAGNGDRLGRSSRILGDSVTVTSRLLPVLVSGKKLRN